MKIRTNVLSGSDWPADSLIYQPDTLYVDIETTGLDHRRSHIYLMGAMWTDKGQIRLQQWLAERPSEEKDILAHILELIKGNHRLVHYNGTTFDIPYMKARAAYHGLAPDQLDLAQTDLYTRYRSRAKTLRLCDSRLQTLQAFVGFQRRDNSSGKELIRVYQDYLRTLDASALDRLFLHNYEDIAGLPNIEQLEWFDQSASQPLIPENIRSDRSPDNICLTFMLKDMPSFSFSISEDMGTLSCSEGCFSLTVPVQDREIRLYYPDPENYMYLPAEDRCIHKSVAAFIPREYRVKASKANCYDHISLDQGFLENLNQMKEYLCRMIPLFFRR